MVAGTKELVQSRAEGEDVKDVQTIEYRGPVMKSLRVFLGALLPTVDWPLWAIGVQAAIASMGAAFSSMNFSIRWLVIGIIADLMTGVACTWLPEHKTPMSKMGTSLFARLVGLYMVVQLGKEPALQVELMGYSTSWGELFAMYFLTGIWSSVAKHMGYLGFPWPKWAVAMLDKVHSGIDNADISSKLISAITSYSSQANSDTKQVSKKPDPPEE